jgi:hypothetical protein
VTLRRTRIKEDGVATYVHTERFDIVASHDVRFFDAGDRVALVVLLRARKVPTHTHTHTHTIPCSVSC